MNADNRNSEEKSTGLRGGGGRRPFGGVKHVRSLGTTHQKLITRIPSSYPGISLSGVKSSFVGLLPCPPKSKRELARAIKRARFLSSPALRITVV